MSKAVSAPSVSKNSSSKVGFPMALTHWLIHIRLGAVCILMLIGLVIVSAYVSGNARQSSDQDAKSTVQSGKSAASYHPAQPPATSAQTSQTNSTKTPPPQSNPSTRPPNTINANVRTAPQPPAVRVVAVKPACNQSLKYTAQANRTTALNSESDLYKQNTLMIKSMGVLTRLLNPTKYDQALDSENSRHTASLNQIAFDFNRAMAAAHCI